jgi:hypothetical protein
MGRLVRVMLSSESNLYFYTHSRTHSIPTATDMGLGSISAGFVLDGEFLGEFVKQCGKHGRIHERINAADPAA